MNQHLTVGREPNLQKIIIASAVLHVLLIALIAFPVRKSDRVYESYFVHLVSLTEAKKGVDTKSAGEHSGKEIKSAKAPSDIKKREEKMSAQAEIAREKNVSEKTYTDSEKSSSELLWKSEQSINPSDKEFKISRDFQRPKEDYKQDKMQPHRTDRAAAFAAAQDFQEQQFTIAKASNSIRSENAGRDMKAGFHEQPDTTSRHIAQFDSFGQTGGSVVIEKPGLSGKSGGREGSYKGRDDHIPANIPKQEERILSENDTLQTSDIYIQGVPLTDLITCANALDEGMLRRKILNVVGSKRECYSPTTGKFVFLATGRYTSFDMIIIPASGREPSNRCDELTNALNCLHSTKE